LGITLETLLATVVGEVEVDGPQVAGVQRPRNLFAVSGFDRDVLDVYDGIFEVDANDFAFFAGEVASHNLDGVARVDADPSGVVLLAELRRERRVHELVPFVQGGVLRFLSLFAWLSCHAIQSS